MPDFVRSVRPSFGLVCLCAVGCAVVFTGCASWLGTQPVLQNELVNHYNAMATNVARLDPTVQSNIPAPAMGPGRDLTQPNLEDRWNLTLAEALRLGVQNNVIVRQNAQFMSPNNPLMQSADTVPSIYDAAIQNAGVIFGQRGVDAALSDFDPRFTVTMKNGEDQTPDNTTNLAPPGNVLDNNYSQVQTKLEQQLMTGGILSINQNWSYSLSNQPAQLFNSAYTGVLGAEYRQPLWAGSGSMYTSIAGPITQRARGFSLVNQGLVIAHINQTLSEIDFLENLQNLTREIGDLYWDLYQNYQDYEAENATSKVAKELWDRMTNREDLEPGVEVAQAEDAYFESKAREEQALSNLFITEGKLRRLLGLAIDDRRMIYPIDEPMEREIPLNRAMCLYEALCNRTELTRQKTNLHSLQLQLLAARKLVAPKLDFVGGYALNGFGHNFLNGNATSPPINTINGTTITGLPFNSAVSNLLTGRETSWSAGFEYSIPLWLRQEKAQVRQLELRIVKARAALAAQEDEIAHELNSVLMTIKRSHSMSKFAHRRLQAARKRVIAAQSEYEAGSKSNDLFLRALTSKSQAQVAYARSITEYNKSLRDLLFRTGHLLSADGIETRGVDGLPLGPPPTDSNPFSMPPKPTDPELLPAPGANENDELPSPTPPKKGPLASSGKSHIFTADFAEEEDAPEISDNSGSELFEQPQQKSFWKSRPTDPISEFDFDDEEIVPVSGRE